MRPVALVTGASRGIGHAIALRLAETHHVLLVARERGALDEVALEISARGGVAEVLPLDLTVPAQIAERLRDQQVDVVVHNAGVGVMKPLLELTPDEWHRMMDVNVNALFHVTRAVLPGMVSRGHGHVVIIGSIAGRSAFVGGAGYATTKHAVMGFAENLMLEVRDDGVKVSVVSPGSVATTFGGRTEPKGDGQLLADDVAAAVMAVIDTPPEVLLHRVEVRILSPKRPRA
ncbi:SDR family oxidoreductase [Gemmatimonas sp.]|jgi:NADP-dependent 3-hydroxy acid dehydrogenase YdfG|uniref:SDR family oxidoreductase n=1 Tax=Gemmatimonas sp. TaxID=1962908 RepID=UPI0037BFBB74